MKHDDQMKFQLSSQTEQLALNNAPPFTLQMVALWSIILTFMVLIVALCSFDDQMFADSSWKIRKEFGVGAVRKSDNMLKEEEGISFLQNTLVSAGFSGNSNLIAVITNDFGVEFLIRTSISFSHFDVEIAMKDREYLDRFGSVFFNLPDWSIGIYCINKDSGEKRREVMLNCERASAVARYLHTVCGLPLERLIVWSSSYEHFATIFPDIMQGQAENVVFLSLMKVKKRAKSA
jgi:hypothetical protein